MDNSQAKQRVSPQMSLLLTLVVFAVMISGAVLAYWIIISVVRWMWNNPLF